MLAKKLLVIKKTLLIICFFCTINLFSQKFLVNNYNTILAFEKLTPPQQIPKNEDLSNTNVYLITVGLGVDLHARYGHSFLKIEQNYEKYIYNWGAFSFDDPFFAVKFFLGERNYWVENANEKTLIDFYKHYEDRNVWQKKINLSDKQKIKLINAVNEQISRQNMVFRYEHFYRNCATKIRDIINLSLDNYPKDRLSKELSSKNYRDYVVDHMSIIPALGFLLDIAMNSLLDIRLNHWTESFYPIKLDEYLSNLYSMDDNKNFLNQKLLSHKKILVNASSKHETYKKNFSLWWLLFWMLPIFLLLLFTAFNEKSQFFAKTDKTIDILYKLVSIFWGSISGIIGILMIISWLFSTHYDMHHNLNILVLFALDFYYIFWSRTKHKKPQTANKSQKKAVISQILSYIIYFMNKHTSNLFKTPKLAYISLRLAMIFTFLMISIFNLSNQNVNTVILYVLPIQLAYLLLSAKLELFSKT